MEPLNPEGLAKYIESIKPSETRKIGRLLFPINVLKVTEEEKNYLVLLIAADVVLRSASSASSTSSS